MRFKDLVTLAVISTAIFIMPQPAFADSSVSILCNDKLVQSDVPPMIESGRVLAPLRAVFESLGATVDYDSSTRTITAQRGARKVLLLVDSTYAELDGKPTTLDVPARIYSGRTMVPLRFASEAMGAVVTWNEATRMAQIDTTFSDRLDALIATQKAESEKPLATVSEVAPDVLSRSYSWEYGGYTNSLDLRFSKAHYDYFKNLPRLETGDYSLYVTNTNDDTYMAQLVKVFRDVRDKRGYSDFQTMEMIAAFVQSIEYRKDIDTTGYDEYPKYPFETLVEKGGDCEDTSILLASLLKETGYGAVLLGMPGHMAVGLACSADTPGTYFEDANNRFYYIETTASGWGIGQKPEETSPNAQIFYLTPRPLLTVSTETANNLLYISVINKGTAPVNNTFVHVALDAGGNQVYKQMDSKPFRIEPNQKVTIPLYMTYPPGVYTRLMVSVIGDGQMMATQNYDWFYTE